jgi:hypothetical protein
MGPSRVQVTVVCPAVVVGQFQFGLKPPLAEVVMPAGSGPTVNEIVPTVAAPPMLAA